MHCKLAAGCGIAKLTGNSTQAIKDYCICSWFSIFCVDHNPKDSLRQKDLKDWGHCQQNTGVYLCVVQHYHKVHGWKILEL